MCIAVSQAGKKGAKTHQRKCSLGVFYLFKALQGSREQLQSLPLLLCRK